MLTVSEDAEIIKESIRAGAMGYVFKSAEKEELELALQTILAGKKYYNEAALIKLAKNSKRIYVLAPGEAFTLKSLKKK